jgi:hypothetical protein
MVMTYGVIERLAGVDVFGLADPLQVEHGPWSDRGFPAWLPECLFTLDRSLTPSGSMRPRSGGFG